MKVTCFLIVRLEFHDPPEEGYNLRINGRFLFLFDSTLCDYCPLRVDGEMMELKVAFSFPVDILYVGLEVQV